MFVDRVTIELIAGKGGDGCLSFRREKYVPRGGPDGGDGGNGGSIIIQAEAGVDSLTALSHRKFWKADRGHHGSGQNRRGKDGNDVTVKVPPGTIIIDAEHDFVIKDLVEDGDSFVAAQGGKGGKGNARFKSSVNQVPREWTPGAEGEARKFKLELKVIADVGLVGKPNAGKSTLLSRVTKATPQIADYPFTTKFPNLGRVVLDWERTFIMADIPGLIEGASDGVGLGHEFLRHIERAGILVHLVEPQPMDGTDPLENYHAITDELVQYNEQLGQRPQLVAVTKAELPDAEQVRDQLAAATNSDVFLISSVTGQGLNELSNAIFQALQQASG
ncbi:MAG: GTPase ObgE [Pirellulaceae bacterium]|nr:GTPase ObgE [Rhodopirellula sp.]MBL98199.1 GTPase ObgE [Rhodopirellula sp.]MCH2598029.1 GTPase ObgE [Pirellulales bacterium]|tara:strand:+ start:6461 stop:7456 length:996 start_codon:yes stop_codon:yes gene_type:complete